MRWIKQVLTAFLMLSVLSLGTAPLTRAGTTITVSDNVTISSVVAAKRQLVIDPTHIIIQIFSNTDENITPEVTLGSETGPVVSLDSALKAEYEHLSRQLRPGATGLVYQQPLLERTRSLTDSPAQSSYARFSVMLILNRTDFRVIPGDPSTPAPLWPWLGR